MGPPEGVGVYATTAKTAMAFRQIVGRFVRAGSGGNRESWLYLPAEPILRSHAARIEDEIDRAAKREEDLDGELDERAKRLETEPDLAAAMPAFQRRKHLRADRHRLISDLARKRRWTHREANVWINGKTGVRRVDDATIDQLQRSCDLLVEELIRASRPRA